MELNINRIIKKTGPGSAAENVVLAPYMSMKVGGPARYFFEPKSAEDAAFILKEITDAGLPYYVIGNGTNIIVRDEGYDGAIIHFKDNFSQIKTDGNIITAEAGATLKKIAAAALENSLAGFEFASGIPGSLGGAVTMNAGAYGGEMKDVIRSVTAMDRDGNIRRFDVSECDLTYRHSLFSDGKLIVLEAEIKLSPGDKCSIAALMDDLQKQREDKQPLEYPSCGSVFKRPEGSFAGKLIMDSNLKGARVGGASVSEKHAGFIINDRNGSAADVLAVIELVKETVLKEQGVALECEVKIL